MHTGIPLTAVYTFWCGPVDTAEADVFEFVAEMCGAATIS